MINITQCFSSNHPLDEGKSSKEGNATITPNSSRTQVEYNPEINKATFGNGYQLYCPCYAPDANYFKDDDCSFGEDNL